LNLNVIIVIDVMFQEIGDVIFQESS